MIDAFLKFESDHNLFSHAIDGFLYWPYIRFSVYEKIYDSMGAPDDIGQGRKTFQFSEVINIVKNITFFNPLFKRAKKDILFICHQRRVLEDGKYICIYTDLLSEKYKENSVCAEFLYGYKHFKPIKYKNTLMLDVVDIFPFIQNLVHKGRYKNIFVKLDRKAEQLSKLIEAELKRKIEPCILANWMKRRFVWYQYKKPILKKFLKNIEPKVIIEVVGYETDKMILNEVANELGICTVELQHGVIGRGHCAYNYFENHRYNYMPSKLFVFADYWKKTCRFPIGEENIVSVGFPYMEKQMSRYPPADIDEKIIKIIVISQPGVTGELIGFTCSVIEKMKCMDMNYKIIYKFHPAEYSIASKNIALLQENENVKIINDSKISLYSLFSECDYQIGINSTAVFEGLSYDLATFIFTGTDADVENYMCDLKQNKYVCFGNTAMEFIQLIKICKNKIKHTDNNLFFKKNSLMTMTEKINSILECSYE